MKIVKIGKFDGRGMPTEWHFDLEGNDVACVVDSPDQSTQEYCLGLDMLHPGSVDIKGVEIEEWTLARKIAQEIGGGVKCRKS